MSMYVAPVARLIDEFEKLPGIGHKTAQRLAFHILNMPYEKAIGFAKAIVDAKKTVKYCSVCGDLTDIDPCRVCGSDKRDRSVICVVENPRDVVAMEKVREYKGLYHVLHVCTA